MVYQRRTGPTYPVSGRAELSGLTIAYTLARTHGGDADHPVAITVPETSATGVLEWRRHKTNDPWTNVRMARRDSMLEAVLPHQPPAGKLEYRVILRAADAEAVLPAEGKTVIRFKGHVPMAVVIAHVFAVFMAMLLSTRAGLESLRKEPRLVGLTVSTLAVLALGGLILGPVMQKLAFGAYWTGWPFGHDLTDNKTLVALIGWVAALVALRRSRFPRRWVLGASIVLFLVYLIPHSLLGSEIDYAKVDRQKQIQLSP